MCESILVVDDNVALRTALVSALKARGFETHGAGNGAEAMRLLGSKGAATLIFLDLMMPKLNGWDFLKSLKASRSEMKDVVVLMSAVNHAMRPEHTNHFEFAGVLHKPIVLGAVLALVEKFVHPSVRESAVKPNDIGSGPSI